jgi:glycosyltransferase involved in cell wall biosynthesis
VAPNLRNPAVRPSNADNVSVCLLTYNHVDVIESTLRTVLDQTVSGYEVVVSDDCSSDGTWEKILQVAKSDPRLVPIRTPQRMGMAGNANFAVARSVRPYIALLHHDDLYRRDLLEKWAHVLDRNPEAGFVFNPYGTFQSTLVSGESMPAECIDGRWLLERYLLPSYGERP